MILAFPAKSPNRTKVVGSHPDLGEGLALSFLQSLCSAIGTIYPPGARVTVCSDGHVFSDLVGVSDPVVTAYTSAIRKMIGDVGGEQLAIYTLADAFDLSDYDSMRRALEQRFALTLAEVRLRVRGDIASRALFNGIHRFLFEDEVTARIGESRNQVRKSCKDLAYRVIRRSDAWSAVVGQMFPGALRLSVHPQSSHSEKLGIHLVPTRDNWLTPWHGVVLDDGASLRLVKRREAEELGARLLWRDGLPSHYVLAGRQ